MFKACMDSFENVKNMYYPVTYLSYDAHETLCVIPGSHIDHRDLSLRCTPSSSQEISMVLKCMNKFLKCTS